MWGDLLYRRVLWRQTGSASKGWHEAILLELQGDMVKLGPYQGATFGCSWFSMSDVEVMRHPRG